MVGSLAQAGEDRRCGWRGDLARGLLNGRESDGATAIADRTRTTARVSDADQPHPYPDGIEDRHVRPVAGWRRHASPLGLVVFGVIVALALSGLLGHERTWAAEASGTRLEVHTSEIIRNGEFVEMRIRVRPAADIAELVIGVDDALWEDITVNTLIPAASEEANENGETRFTFAELSAGTEFLFKVDMQINPDILGGNEGDVTLYDGDTPVVSIPISITVLP
jgi:hypothetical protein